MREDYKLSNMRKERRIPAVNKSDIGFIAALLKMNTDIEVTWKAKEIRLLSEQILIVWHLVKNAAKFTREMTKFSDQLEKLQLPRQAIGRLMARELAE